VKIENEKKWEKLKKRVEKFKRESENVRVKWMEVIEKSDWNKNRVYKMKMMVVRIENVIRVDN
jgi:hypothetical protein